MPRHGGIGILMRITNKLINSNVATRYFIYNAPGFLTDYTLFVVCC